jgi:hypothetical protein
MSKTQRDLNCSPEDAFAVLSDGWLFAVWVVGASRIRDVDEGWPRAGATIHHSVGTWPLLINDTTTVVDVREHRSLRLRARAWPFGEADVLIEIAATTTGCRVTITEDAVRGPGVYVPQIILDVLLNWRNVETLRRLGYLAEGQARPVSGVSEIHTRPAGEGF